jgi:hypothetical protein
MANGHLHPGRSSLGQPGFPKAALASLRFQKRRVSSPLSCRSTSNGAMPGGVRSLSSSRGARGGGMGRSGGPAKHSVGAQQGPARSSPRPRPQRSSHPSYSHRTKRAITRTDGAAPRPSERLVARGRSDEIWGGPHQIWGGPPQIWGGPPQIWGGPPQTGRARTQRYTAPRHPAYARASSSDQWQSEAISGNQWQSMAIEQRSVALTRNPDAIRGNQWPSTHLCSANGIEPQLSMPPTPACERAVSSACRSGD